MGRQAIVIVHGMGEQRPVETLNQFSKTVTRIRDATGAVHHADFYSRGDRIEGSFEGRRHLIPEQTIEDAHRNVVGRIDTQTEVFEYHWAHLMTGNRLDDLWPTFRRVIFPANGVLQSLFVIAFLALAVAGWAWAWGPSAGAVPFAWAVTAVVVGLVTAVATLWPQVPRGLVVVWLLMWVAVGWVAWAFAAGPLAGLTENSLDTVIGLILGGGIAAAAVSYLASRVLPGWLASSFVDVVRYLDTSPRSLDVRRKIRSGIVDLLDGLHDEGRYDRIVIVAHSLGSYIAYDAISYLWSLRGHRGSGVPADELQALEEAAAALGADGAGVAAYQDAQYATWFAMRATSAAADGEDAKKKRTPIPWLITDFVSFGSPMYFADRLYTRNPADFRERIRRRELVTCPPVKERTRRGDVDDTSHPFTYRHFGRHVFHEAAPFALVRWTNLWYPSRGGFFGDWFGGALAPLWGWGIRDVPLHRNGLKRLIPGYAHAAYLTFPDEREPGTFAGELDGILGLFTPSHHPPGAAGNEAADDPEGPGAG